MALQDFSSSAEREESLAFALTCFAIVVAGLLALAIGLDWVIKAF